MSLEGDFGKLESWGKRIAGMASGVQVSRVSEEMSRAALGFINEEFESGRSPTGSPWAPKKRPDGRRVGHGKTGKLARYRIKNATARGFTVHNPSAPYRGYFHGGTRRMVARQISPGSTLPRRWESAFQRIWVAHCLLKLRGV
jgi:hypothetical protein